MITQTARRLSNSVPHVESFPGINRVKSHTSLFDFENRQRCFQAKESLFCEGDLALYAYKVLRGVIRSYRSLTDGGRQIEAFRMPGDLFGFDGDGLREFSAEAIDDVTVLLMHRSMLLARAETDHDASYELLAATEAELRRVQRHAMLLAMNAHQRVASFLLEMSRRLSQTEVLELPMSRQDIADYLGLTIETVSRMLTQLETARLIGSRASRHVILLDIPALRHMTQ